MRKIVDFCFILLITLLGGSVFFAFKYGIEVRVILFSFSIILLMFSLKNKCNNIVALVVICLILFLNTFLNVSYGVKITSLIALIIVCISLAIIQDNVSKEKFMTTYINIMAVLCCISLICFFLSKFISPYNFPLFKREFIDTNIYSYSIYYTWGWDALFKGRNAGIYWEPGGFQTYINLALTFLIFNKAERKGYFYIMLLLFIVTIITTSSTTGYIVLAIILAYSFLTNKIKFKSKKEKMRGFIVIGSIVLTSLYLIVNSNVINDKFGQQGENSSYSIRKNDSSSTLEIIKKYPLKGTGIFSDLKYYEEGIRGVKNNSNGILEFVEIFGIPVSVLYIIWMYIKIKEFYCVNNIIDSTVILFIFIILFSSEGVVLRPVFMTFLFSWKRKINSDCKL